MSKSKATSIKGKSSKRRGRPAKAAATKATDKGYQKNPDGEVLIPIENKKEKSTSKPVVAASKMKKGLEEAQKSINDMVKNFSNSLSEPYSIKEIEFSISIDSKGSFLGFGIGTGASIKVKIAPND